MDNSTAALLQPPAEESQSSLVVLSVMGTRASHCRRWQSQLFVPFLNVFLDQQKIRPSSTASKARLADQGKNARGVTALPRRLLALASLSVLPVPRSRMSGGRVLRVVRMRFLHCFLSRHCDVCVLVPHVAHRRQGAWQQQQAAAEHSVMSMATLAITVEGTSPGIPTH